MSSINDGRFRFRNWVIGGSVIVGMIHLRERIYKIIAMYSNETVYANKNYDTEIYSHGKCSDQIF